MWSIPNKWSIVRGDPLFDRFVAEIVARPDLLTALNTGACHPAGHGSRIVIASDPPLGNRHPTKPAVPGHQRLSRSKNERGPSPIEK